MFPSAPILHAVFTHAMERCSKREDGRGFGADSPPFKHSPTAEVEPQWKSAHALCDVYRVPDEGHFSETLFKTITAQSSS